MRTMSRALTLFAILSGLLAALIEVTAASVPRAHLSRQLLFPQPTQDDFYRVPKNIDSFKPGDVIRTRGVPPLTLAHFASAQQVLYRTTGALGEGDATVTTIISPLVPRPGPPKLLAVAAAIDSSSIDCAPSYALATMAASRNVVLIRILSDPYISAALSRGYYITIPDYLGSKSAFLSGKVEGQGMLDGIRAALKYKPQLANADVAIIGYSGGAHAGGFAGHHWAKYAPELKLKGIAIGGLPADNIATLKNIDGGQYSALTWTGAVGLSAAHPELDAYYQSILKENGRKTFQRIGNGGDWCLLQAVAGLSGVSLSTAFTDPNALESPTSLKVFDEEKMGNQGGVTQVPTYVYHSMDDDIVPYSQAAAYVDSQCKQGATIHLHSVKGLPHIPAGVASIPTLFDQVKQYLEDDLGAKQKKQGCVKDGEEASKALNDPNSSASRDLLGSDAVAQINRSLQQVSGNITKVPGVL